jgi:hypothetical protein
MRSRFAFVLSAIALTILMGVLPLIFPSVSYRVLFALYAFLTMLSLKVCGVDEWPRIGWVRTIIVGGTSAIAAYVVVPLISRFNLGQILEEWVRSGNL